MDRALTPKGNPTVRTASVSSSLALVSPLNSDVVVNGGIFVPKRALDRFATWIPGERNIAIVGDSILQGTGIPGASLGYLDNMVTRLQRSLGNALGGSNGAGFFGVWRSSNTLGFLNSINEWTFSGTVPTLASTASPNQLGLYQSAIVFAAGAANIGIFTPPPNVAARFVADCVTSGTTTITSATAAFSAATDVGQTIYGTNIPRNACITDVTNATTATISLPATGSGSGGRLGLLGRNIAQLPVSQVQLYWVDNATAPAWSYSVDGGGSWVNVVSTTPAVATLKRTNVTTTLPSGDIRVRAANAAGVAKSFIFLGVGLRSVTNPTSGVTVHNLARDGACWNNIVTSGANTGFVGPGGSADYWRILDNNGDSTQPSLAPTLVIAMFSNDVDLLAAGTITLAQHQANVQAFIDRMFPYSDLLIMNPMEQSRTATPATQQSYRDATKAVCIANGVAYCDIYDAWAAQGTTGYAACNADGLMLQTVHPSLEGHADMMGHVARILATLAV